MAALAWNNAAGIFSVYGMELACGFDATRGLPQFDRLGNIDLLDLLGDVQNFEWRGFVDGTLLGTWERALEKYEFYASSLPR